MVSKPVVQTIVTLAIGLWAILLTIQGVAVELAWLRWVSLITGVVVLLLLAFDRWLWRLRPIRRLVRVPVVSGTWKGKLTSAWRDPQSGEQRPPTTVYLSIRQTYSTIDVCLISEESRSASLAARLETGAGGAELTYTYRNAPKLLIQDRSRVHEGTAVLQVHGEPPAALTGHYWTSRDTKGEIEFRDRVPTRHSDYETAAKAFRASSAESGS